MKKSVLFAFIIAIVFLICLTTEVSATLNISSFDNYTIYLPNQATLANLVTSTYNNYSITYNWSKVSGPGTVTFSRQNYSVTDISFSATGNYTLRINASDGESSTY
jgi:hypothetical protein